MADRLSGSHAYTRILRRVTRSPLLAVLPALVLSLFFAVQLPGLTFSDSVYDLVAENLPETERYRDFKRLFGSDEIIQVVVRAENIFDPATFESIETLARAAEAIAGVKRVLGLPDIRRAVDGSQKKSLAELADLLTPVELFRRNLFSEDRRAAVLTLVLVDDADQDAVIAAMDRRLLQLPPHLSSYQIGMPLVSQALRDFTRKDFLRLPPIAGVLIGLILLGLFGRFTCVLVPLCCVALALVWTFGLTALLRIPVSMVLMIVPVFLIAVGTAYCLYIMADYQTNPEAIASVPERVAATFSRLAFPTVLGVTTTVVGLGALWVTRMPAIREFSLFACFGLASLMVAALTLFPALLVLLPLKQQRAPAPGWLDRLIGRLLNAIVRIDLRHQRISLPLFGLLLGCAVLGIFRLRVETNPLGYFKANTSISRHFHDIHRDLAGSFPVHVMVTGPDEDHFERYPNLAAIEKLQKFLENLPGVDKTVSFPDYLRLINYVLNRFDPAEYRLPAEGYRIRTLVNNFKSILGKDLFARFMDPNLSTTNILMLTHLSSSREFLDTRRKITAYLQANFPPPTRAEVTGFGMLAAQSTHLLTRGQVKSLAITLGVVGSIMFFLFLSLKVGLLAIVPNMFPIVINFGIMGWLGIELSMATSLIASIAIGLAVDDTIHYLVRYNREFKKDLNRDRALEDTLLHIGRPMLYTTLAIGLGFSVLLFSHFKPTAVFGLLMVVTMVSALAADLILLPSLMLHVELITAWDLLKLMPVAGGLSPERVHELNQPLNAVKMGVDFLNMLLQRGEHVSRELLVEVIGELDTQVDRAAGIVARLKKLGQKGALTKGVLDVNASVRELEAARRPQLEVADISLELKLNARPLQIWASGQRILQVLFSLVSNAVEAIQTIPGDARRGDRFWIAVETSGNDQWVQISIADNGPGMPEHVRDRIFEPFFSTRQSGMGRGLGLTTSREIVRDHGGHLQVESRPGNGTRIRLFFPACKPPAPGDGPQR